MQNQWNSHTLLVESKNDTMTQQNSLAVSEKLNTYLPHNPTMPFLGIYPRGIKADVHTQTLHISVHNSFSYNSPTLQTIHVFINRRMDKQIELQLQNGILLGNKKELIIDTHNNMGEYQNNNAEWKKPDTFPATPQKRACSHLNKIRQNENESVVTGSRSVVSPGRVGGQVGAGGREYQGL